MTACLLAGLRRLGLGDHPNVIASTEALAERLLSDGGISCYPMDTSLLSHCYMALPKLLHCFGEVPLTQRSPVVQQAIEWIVKELVDHQIHIHVPGNRKAWDAARPKSRKRADLPAGETPASWREKAKAGFLGEHGLGELEAKTGWTRFGFPLNYNSDILEAMRALAAVGTPMSEALEKPLRVIREKRTTDGVWLLDKSLNAQMLVDVERKGHPSKWITVFALIVLEHFSQ